MSRYVFDPHELRDVALRHVGKPVPRMGELEAVRVGAGEFLVTRPMEAFAAQVEDHVFFLEYCRGPLITLMPFGFVNFLSTFDFKSGAQITASWLKLVWRSRRVRATRPALA